MKKISTLKIEMKYFISIAISIAIIVFTFISVLMVNLLKKQNTYEAENGVLDLTNWSSYDTGVIELPGTWEFYPGVLIDSVPREQGGDRFQEYQEIKRYVDVPGKWNSYIGDNGSSEGSGTYRLIIKVPEEGTFAIKTSTIRSSANIFSNGKKVASFGHPSLTLEGFSHGSRYKVGALSSNQGEIELVIQVSNYLFTEGGILKPIRFGTFETIKTIDDRERGIDVFIVSTCIVVSIFYLFLYVQKRTNSYLGYFSGFLFFFGIYMSTLKEQVLSLVVNYSFTTRLHLQICLIIGIISCFLNLAKAFLGDYCNHKLIKVLLILLKLMLLFPLNTMGKRIFIPVGAEQAILTLVTIFCIAYTLWVFIKAIYKRTEFLEYFLVMATALLSYGIVMALKVLFEITYSYITEILILFIIISAALYIKSRLRLDYEESVELSRKLAMYDRIKNEFFAKTSRELKEPLHRINHLTRSLLEGSKGALNAGQQEDLLFVNQEGERIYRLVDGFLDASQIEKGEIELNLEPVSPYMVVENLIEEMKSLISEKKSLKLYNKIPKDFPSVKADLDRFTQVIYNLIYNLIKHMKEGTIIFQADVEDGEARFQVINEGLGFINEPLEDNANKVDLSFEIDFIIIRQLIKGHGGASRVEKNHNKDLVFIFTLPIFVPEENRFQEKENPGESQFRLPEKEVFDKKDAFRILIVDSGQSSQKNLADITRQVGLNVDTADKGKEAMAVLEQKNIDLVISDFILRDMSGIQLCKEIRSKYSMAELPIIILSTTIDMIGFANTFEFRANDFLKKPVNKEELKTKVLSLLQTKVSMEKGIEKELQYFYSQISPHFLFNTLNTIIGLSYKDSDETRKALNNLSIYFREKLDVYKNKGLSSLERELELVKAYLEIEEMRHREKLRLEYDIEEGITAMIPPLTLQPLAENSVRHGIMPKSTWGTVKISVKREESDRIGITIEDDGVGMTTEVQNRILSGKSDRIGFTNVIRKLKVLKGAEFMLSSIPGEGTRIKIIIPEAKEDEGYFN